jgi:hypothetical protein
MRQKSNKSDEGTHRTNKFLLVPPHAPHIPHPMRESSVFPGQSSANSGPDVKTFHKPEKEKDDKRAYNESIEHTPLYPHSTPHRAKCL